MTKLALNSPPERRYEMAVMVWHTVAIPVALAAFFLCCAFPPFWPFILYYLVFMWLDPRPERGTVLTPFQRWTRQAWWWKSFASYFPVRLHKTADLKPCFEIHPSNDAGQTVKNVLKWWYKILVWWYFVITFRSYRLAPKATGQRYIFGYHPHGIIGMGAVGGIATEGAGWSKLFPGIPVRLLTLRSNFFLPFYREYLLSIGACSVSRSSCMRLLRNNNPICIVLGGARESLLAKPGKMDLILNNRFGFVKIALRTGASMVPVLAYGETNIYQQLNPDNSDGPLQKYHKFMTKYMGFTIPLFHARGVFNYNKGILPYRNPIDIVVGDAVDVPLIKEPTDEQVKHYHGLYVSALRKLYDSTHDKYWNGDPLRIVD